MDQPDPTSEPPCGEPPGARPPPPAAPLSNRFGRLAAIFGAAILIAVGLNAALGTGDGEDADTPESHISISPEQMPRGALAGEPAPPIHLPMFDGTTFDLAEHVESDGRPLVLNFWASWCFPCRVEMPEFDEVARAAPEVQFIGIAIEDVESAAREFADEIQVSYPLGIDSTGDIAGVYPHIGLPTTYFIHGDGTVARQVQGQVTKALLEAIIEFDFAA